MSKMDNLRAMREAKYDANAKRAAGTGSRAPQRPAPVAPSATPAATSAAAAAEAPGETDEALCGHRNMSGRTCTREAGHSAKSHRYS